jgi:hypothetical protein
MSYDPKAAERARHIEYFHEGEFTLDAHGAYRWKRSDNVIPCDIVQQWAQAGLVTPRQRAAHEIAYRADMQAFMGRYAAAQAARTPEQLAEERAEMLAAFGPGETVVNVLTGRKTTL